MTLNGGEGINDGLNDEIKPSKELNGIDAGNDVVK